ncbi:MAG: protein-export chaperone SecB [Mucilaginibacter sp.]|uniref:protein-export chaperone SecB n=1 Tax=Mucilaginibacter sp. TaxID=1882438 RepID=UPI0034E3DFC0
MEEIKKSSFRFKRFVVIEFNIKREPVEQGDVDFTIDPSAIIDEANKLFELKLGVYVVDKSGSFNIKLVAIGYFEFDEEKSVDTLSNYFYVNAPALIFPYIRAYISSITALSGLRAVNLPVLNLSGLKDELKANTKKEEIEKIDGDR